VALAWAFKDERDGLPDALLDVIESGAAIVPAHWVLEVTNGLLHASRRKRLRPLEHLEILERIGLLPIRIDSETVSRGWFDTLSLAETYGLTTYDAAYLELALRLDAPLVTLDGTLVAAAERAGLPVFY